MRLNHEAIASLIPHAGSMVLLDQVIGYDADHLHATSASHRLDSNPLRQGDRLPITAGIEYAAQAAAIHGALTAHEHSVPRPGFLAMVRDLHWCVTRLDTIESGLDVRVTRLNAQTGSVMYAFQLLAGTATLMTGRLAVFFPEGEQTR